jgi:hypothetical protein
MMKVVVLGGFTLGLLGCGPSATERLDIGVKCDAAVRAKRNASDGAVVSHYSFSDAKCYGLIEAFPTITLIDGVSGVPIARLDYGGSGKSGWMISNGGQDFSEDNFDRVQDYINGVMERK